MISLRKLSVPLVALALSACAGLKQPASTVLPVNANAVSSLLPQGYQFKAVMELKDENIPEQYLVALDSTRGWVRLALLTVHGVPVFTVTSANGQLDINEQTQLSGVLTPNQALSFLVMIYGEEEAVRVYSRGEGVDLELRPGLREYNKKGAGHFPIVVKYRGVGPWFDEVELKDTQNDLVVLIITLGSQRVLPE